MDWCQKFFFVWSWIQKMSNISETKEVISKPAQVWILSCRYIIYSSDFNKLHDFEFQQISFAFSYMPKYIFLFTAVYIVSLLSTVKNVFLFYFSYKKINGLIFIWQYLFDHRILHFFLLLLFFRIYFFNWLSDSAQKKREQNMSLLTSLPVLW
jgi:hypothetical protein